MPHAVQPLVPLGQRAAYSLAEVAALTGLSMSGLYQLVRTARLRTQKIGGRTIVTKEELDALLGLRQSEPSPAAPLEATLPPRPRGRPRKPRNRPMEAELKKPDA